ncbi:MAG: hypothetical protein CMH25_01360 [Micavibrio sp.]|nr:hypothetical protein [Micavibrio sp.]|tara:strand:+ start:273285 stop:274001 length:717 start_codon:yes stop_codon:yes gene_type:complete
MQFLHRLSIEIKDYKAIMSHDNTALRDHMVWSQIEPDGVQDSKVLEAFRKVPREAFLLPEKSFKAYLDEDVRTENNRTLLAPSLHARMLQALDITNNDIALVIGDANGYGCCVASELASTVVQLDASQNVIARSEEHFNNMHVVNVVSTQGDMHGGCTEHAPYNVIYINGAIARKPENILKCLTDGGRCVCLIQPKPRVSGQVVLFEKVDENNFSETPLFNAQAPYLEGFAPVEEFSL